MNTLLCFKNGCFPLLSRQPAKQRKVFVLYALCGGVKIQSVEWIFRGGWWRRVHTLWRRLYNSCDFSVIPQSKLWT